MDKVSIVTGGMSGIGLAAIKFLLARQWIVVATTSNRELFKKTTSLHHKNLKITPLAGNDAINLKPFIESILAKYGKIDMLINHEELAIHESDEFKDYATAAVAMSNHVLPCMKGECSGHIFFITFSESQEGQSNMLIDEFINQNQDCLQDIDIKFSVIDPAKNCLL